MNKTTIAVIGKTGQVAMELKALRPDWIFLERSQCDLAQVDKVKESLDRTLLALKPNVVINAAAYTKVDLAQEEQLLCNDVNNLAVAEIAKWCERQHSKLIHLSTDYVFDGKKSLPYEEKDSANPLNIYGKSKLLSEQAVTASNCRHVIYRTSWVYSPNGQNFFKTMLRLLPDKNLNIVFDQVGTPTLASDIAKVIAKTVEADFFPNSLYHFSNEGVASWYDFAVMIQRLFFPNSTNTITPIMSAQYPQKALRPNFSVMNKSRIKTDLNITIDHWVDALSRCQ